MQPISPIRKHYDRATIFFHWATALLVAGQWLGAQVIDWFPSGPLRVDARSVHITGGVILAALLFARIVWRGTGGRRLPLADRGILNVAAKATHWGLYALLAAMVLVGLFLVWARGDSIFNIFTIPAFDPANKNIPKQTGEIHETIAWIILGLAGVHAAAALFHRIVWKDGVLERMVWRS